MTFLSRRRLLQSSGLIAAAAALGACDTAPAGGGKAGKSLTWWDHTPNLQVANKAAWAKFEKLPGGMPVQYSYHQTSKLGQALQLAKQSGQLPDIHSNAGLKLPLPALIKEGWFQPIELPDEALARVKDTLVEGIHTFDGKVYSFPLAATKQYWAATWFNKDLVKQAGLDPDNPPKTYDEFRTAGLAVRKKVDGNVYGCLFNLGAPNRIKEQVTYLAQAAGSRATMDGIDFTTGQYSFHSEAYVTVLEFLLSLQKDKLLMPGSGTLDDAAARGRWAAGATAYYFDGPWCAGDINRGFKQFNDKLGVGPMLVPRSGMPVTAYRQPSPGMYYLSGKSKKVEAASTLLGLCTEPEYFVDIANAMPQPPPDPEIMAKADVHPAYRQLVEWFNQDAFIAPVPQARNADVAKAQAQQKDVMPNLGELVQGLVSGDITDLRGALKDLSDRSEKARELAIAAATKNGAKVSVEDWAFPDWKPRTDYPHQK